MKPIDFDAHYADFAEKWVRENMKHFPSIDQMEAHLPEVYLRFLNQREDFLGGLSPSEYFARFQRPEELISLLGDYDKGRVDVPDLLLERIVDLGEASIAPLMRLAEDGGAPEPLRIIALNLLIELGADAPTGLCLRLIDARQEHDDLADVAAELLEARGHEVAPQMLERLCGASDDALETYLDLLCNFPGDPRIYEYAERQFLRRTDRRALYASYLAKLGDARALEPLRRALSLSDINYLDYIEIRNAIEALGGEVTLERSFEGDPYYESMRQM